MKKNTSKLHKICVDANVIIESHRVKIWDEVLENFNLITSELVFEEPHFYYNENREQIFYDLNRSSFENIYNLSIDEIKILDKVFDRLQLDSLENPDKEILTLYSLEKCGDYKLCTSDGAVIQSMCLIGKSELLISLESVLNSIGLTQDLKYNFTVKFLKYHIKIGKERRITGDGLLNDILN